MALSQVYSPYLGRYVSEQAPLAGFNFTVTDAKTGLPIQGVYCTIHSALNCTGDADGVYTDSQGKAGIDAQWFVPRSWRVSKEGYTPICSNSMTSQITATLEPTEVIYTVRIFAGTGGETNPRGTFSVAPHTKLTVTALPDGGYAFDYWTYKGQNVGSANPATFTIDRDSITITATFKEVTGPPPNGPPPNGDDWAVTKPVHIFDNVELTSKSTEILKSITRTIRNVDTSVLVGGKMDYSILYSRGNTFPNPDVRILFNDIEVVSARLALNKSTTGTVDLTGLIKNSNTIEIQVTSTILMWAECFFDIWITFGFSEEPAGEPKPPLWPELAWWQWGMIGGFGLGVLYIVVVKPSMPAMPTIVTVPYPVLRPKEGE